MDKNLPNEIKEYLGKQERVIASYKGKYFATEKRIIITKHGHGFEDFSYKHITSINYQKYAKKSLIILGVVFLILGLIMYFAPVIGAISIVSVAIFIVLREIFIVLGAIFIVLAVVFKSNYYRIRTSGGENFKIPGGRRESETEAFIKVIREHG